MIPCASEKEARFITPDIDVGETIECTSDLLEDILEAEENAPQGALKIAIYDEDDLYTFAENQYAVKDALCLWTDVPELLEQALRLYQGRAFWDGTGELEAAFLQEMAGNTAWCCCKSRQVPCSKISETAKKHALFLGRAFCFVP